MILLIEDSEDDIFIFKRVLRQMEKTTVLHAAASGQEALDYLQGAGKYADRSLYPIPSLVFLDLKLPRVHGFEVLAWIRQQPRFANIRVVVLTSSPEASDQERATQLGATTFLIKPPTPETLSPFF